MDTDKPVFHIRSVQEILAPFANMQVSLSRHMRNKLSTVPLDIIRLVDVLQMLAGQELAAERVFEDDKGDNLYREDEHLKNNYVQIAANGQGDALLMNRMDGIFSFFDHNLTQPKVTALFIDFWQFLQLADLIHQYEEWVDQIKIFEEIDLPRQLESCLRMLHPDLPEHYPFAFV
ncbi:hypothetical protein [Paenibacillus macquariensis]|uniref:Uncharacterized protein n=1 Tax=Paenibacillus macquariensis TaxID=948756 RepID=A0ABY1JWC4_9BACL|nr:hypothetical protein [Paenibacillus macquariensis]MEC0090795.1 hypothetical protein [Paenibacillus macquariensis]OAB34536.1 hypothetical protein PMSM_11775 [Paenibacillus macquariensis subsp. macquariensis]SIQ83519.1 hypothetical protein SAMN05421578_104271 [Paenibacillus macquariensis]